MKDLASHAIKSVHGKIDPLKRKNGFELFGLDFMIDRYYKPWLIEINTNPCLETSCPLLARLMPEIIESVFRIAVDPIFPPPLPYPRTKKFMYNEKYMKKNKFQIIFDEKVHIKGKK